MKDTVTLGAAIAALFISMTALFAPPKPAHKSTESAEWDILADELTALKRQINTLDSGNRASPLAHTPTSAAEKAADHSIAPPQLQARIAALEERVNTLASAASTNETGRARQQRVADRFREQVQAKDRQYRTNTLGAEAFYNDDGDSIAEYSDSMRAAFDREDSGINLHDMECLQSVCRVTYESSTNSSDSRSDQVDLSELFAEQVGDAEIEIHYGHDDHGRQTAYVQIHAD